MIKKLLFLRKIKIIYLNTKYTIYFLGQKFDIKDRAGNSEALPYAK